MTLVAAPKVLSGWWAKSHHRALGTTTDTTIRLAIALGAIKSIIRVVDRSTPSLSVDWAAHDPEAVVKSASYTNFEKGHIAINPGPILDTTLDHGRALDVCVGFALHEASHSQESRDRYKYLIKRVPHGPTTSEVEPADRYREEPAFAPMRIAAYLWNLVEDVRIERATSKHWPGFAPYFDAVLDWMWTEMRRVHEMPTTYGPTLTDKLRVAYLACRYPGRLVPSPELDPEIAWWHAWQADYLSDTVDTPTTIQRGLDHLAEDPATSKELEELSTSEKRDREAGERLRAQLDRLIREGAGAEMCVTEGGEVVPLDEPTADAVRQLVREGLVEVRTVVPGEGVSLAPVHVRRPEETPASKRAYVGKPDPVTEALRAALVFRPSAPQHDEKLLKSGQIDDQELYRWAMNDPRVFSERVIEAKPDVFLGLLVDVSGSMADGSHKLEIAQRLAQIVTWATHDQEGVETGVWAHTADVEDGVAEVYRVWRKGDPLSRLGLLSTLPNYDNRDSQAIELVAAEMAHAEQPERVLICLSDGLPSANAVNGVPYGGRPARAHVRQVVKWAASRGVRVIQVAVDPHGIRPAEQAEMFGRDSWIGFRDYASLPRQLAGLLRRYM